MFISRRMPAVPHALQLCYVQLPELLPWGPGHSALFCKLHTECSQRGVAVQKRSEELMHLRSRFRRSVLQASTVTVPSTPWTCDCATVLAGDCVAVCGVLNDILVNMFFPTSLGCVPF